MLTLALFGRYLFPDWAGTHFGRNTDSSFLMWALTWWPYALSHRLNPFLCHLVWVPGGFNLAWSTGVPLASLLAAPITTTAGPVVAYNLLCLSAVVLAAWSAFLLCRSLCNHYAAALIGGYIFGFSSYILGRLGAGHLSLLLVFPLPLIVLTATAYAHRSISRARCAALLALLFSAQFLCSVENAVTVLFFGAIALMLSWYFGSPDQRECVIRLAAPIAIAGGISALLLAPYFYYLLGQGALLNVVSSPGRSSANLLNFFVSTSSTELGRRFSNVSLITIAPGKLGGGDAYFGIPLLLVIVQYMNADQDKSRMRMLLAALGIILVLALGPRLKIGSWTGFGMPWKVFEQLPFMRDAMPGRFIVYAFMVAAIITSLWLANPQITLWWRSLFAFLIIVAGLPNLDAVSGHARRISRPSSPTAAIGGT